MHGPLVERVHIVAGFACASAAIVMLILPPTLAMKSTLTATLFFSAQSSISFFMATSPVGTQWSQRPRLSLPAAPAVRMCTRGRADGGRTDL